MATEQYYPHFPDNTALITSTFNSNFLSSKNKWTHRINLTSLLPTLLSSVFLKEKQATGIQSKLHQLCKPQHKSWTYTQRHLLLLRFATKYNPKSQFNIAIPSMFSNPTLYIVSQRTPVRISNALHKHPNTIYFDSRLLILRNLRVRFKYKWGRGFDLKSYYLVSRTRNWLCEDRIKRGGKKG